jgi:hypothetical protein
MTEYLVPKPEGRFSSVATPTFSVLIPTYQKAATDLLARPTGNG